jgi:ribosome maturation factor RimP
MYRDIPEDLRRLIEPVVEDHGFELMNIENVGAGPALLRITIDRPAGDGRVPVEQLAAVSREIDTQLTTVDSDASSGGTSIGQAISGSYRLEVSSPGLDRMLAREKDFAAACGNEVKLKTRRPLDGRRRFRGKLVDYKNGVAHVAVDGDEVLIPFVEVEKANTVYTFSSADFNGGDPDRVSD